MKATIEISEIRDLATYPHTLQATDDVFTFFYDETYNPRRLYLKNGSTNEAIDECFVLGGVMYRGSTPPTFDLAKLRETMNIPTDVKDLKFRHVAKTRRGTSRQKFLTCAKSKRLTTFLEWLVGSNFYVHFIAVDKLYWSVADLVDSVVPDKMWWFGLAYKSALDDLIRSDVDGFLAILDAHAYPNIKSDDADAFLHDILDYMGGRGAADSEDTRLHDFMGFLEQSLGEEDLPFIMDEKDRTLIDSFAQYYTHRIYLFPRSRHIFDEEGKVAEELSKVTFMLDGIDVNPYSYVASHDSDLTQVSDVIAGVFGRFYSYLAATSLDDIRADRAKMSQIQVRNVRLLCDAMERTSEVSEDLLTSVVNPNFFDKKKVIKGT